MKTTASVLFILALTSMCFMSSLTNCKDFKENDDTTIEKIKTQETLRNIDIQWDASKVKSEIDSLEESLRESYAEAETNNNMKELNNKKDINDFEIKFNGKLQEKKEPSREDRINKFLMRH